MTKAKVSSKFLACAVLSVGAVLCGYALLSPVGKAAQRELARNALWEVVHNVCVPGQAQYGDPTPCLRVDLGKGDREGFAILKDPRRTNQFLLVPTARIAGIESPALREPGAMNYFASAWEARTYLSEALHRALPRDDIGLAVNSAASRTQDQLHIHVACIRGDVLEALHKNETGIGSNWAPFHVPFFGHHYTAMWVPGEDLGSSNPFRLLGQRVEPGRDAGSQSLAVVGLTRADGTKGFVLLADQVNGIHDRANSEELLDHTCRIATSNALRTDSPHAGTISN